jgi:hypothetical protein
MTQQNWIRLAGVAGILGAIGWMLGDMLLVGNYLPDGPHGILFDQYGTRIGAFNAKTASVTLRSSLSRLEAGALLGPLTIPLYLLGCWHLYQGARPAGRWWAVPMAVFLFIGNAYSPLGHAGFYYVAAIYQAIVAAPVDAHPLLLDLADHFSHALMIMYVAAVGCLVLGLLSLILTIATGRSAWPRWMVIVVPLFVIVALSLDHMPFPQPLRAWLAGAGINIAWFLIFTTSTVLLWTSEKAGKDA